jgi:DNA-binding NarL/FixJ family response regulator
MKEKNILIYKDCIQDEHILNELCEYFNDDYISIVSDHTSFKQALQRGGVGICLITRNKILSFDKPTIKWLMSYVTNVRFITMIQPDQISLLPRLLRSGSSGLVLFDDPLEILIDGIKKIHQYGGFISPRVVTEMNLPIQSLIDVQYKISLRQRMIVQELLSGKSDKMIAESLSISYQTMKTHRKNIFKLFNVHSQGELFALLS